MCPRCGKTLDPGASFCGNCGLQIAPTQAAAPMAPMAAQFVPPPQTSPQPQPAINTTSPQPYQQFNPAYPGMTSLPMQPMSPLQLTPQQTLGHHDHSGLAIASFVLGVLGLVAWLMPLIGLVFGILGIIFGTVSLKSYRKVFAIIGTVLSVLVMLVSLFFWVQNAQEILHGGVQGKGATSNTSDSGSRQAVSTPCYTTQIPGSMRLTRAAGSCTFQGTNATTGEQTVVKVIQVPGLSTANLASAARSDAANVVASIPGGSITSQRASTFAGSQAYEVVITATDGSAGMIKYIYDTTLQGNLVIVLHTQAKASGTNYDLSAIEENWSWL